jgi:hypothetical protein
MPARRHDRELRGLREPPVRPPSAPGAALPAGWRRSQTTGDRNLRIPSLAGRGRSARLAALAGTVLAVALAVAGYVAATTPGHGPAAAPAGTAAGTAFLGNATCADWQDANVAKRLAVIGALGVAATQPDPENAGATLGQGQAYGLFQRVCSTQASGSALLYEAYNRAASFRSVGAGGSPVSAPLGHP